MEGIKMAEKMTALSMLCEYSCPKEWQSDSCWQGSGKTKCTKRGNGKEISGHGSYNRSRPFTSRILLSGEKERF